MSVELGQLMPFGAASAFLARRLHVHVSPSTVRRLTVGTGGVLQGLEDAEVERIERELPDEPEQAQRREFEVDGAMVLGVHGINHEMRLLVVGDPQRSEGGADQAVHLREISYFARVCDAEQFTRVSLVELHRRGVGQAKEVGMTSDGAVWIQTFTDLHRPDAVRVLDPGHAATHLGVLAEAARALGLAAPAGWQQRQMDRLHAEGPGALLRDLDAMETAVFGVADGVEKAARPSAAGDTEAAKALRREIAYLRNRAAHLDYPAFRAAGWPIGSGAVESGHKQVMQARLKGAGMRWDPQHGSAVASLRAARLSGRWEATWEMCTRERLRLRHVRQEERRLRRYVPCLALILTILVRQARLAKALDPSPPPARAETTVDEAILSPAQATPPDQAATPLPHRVPKPNHPWRVRALGRKPRTAPTQACA